jgi:ribokinase
MAGHIVIVGSINMDMVVRAPRHPAPGETILGSFFDTFPGGKGANQAIAAARLGGQVKMVGRVGNDSFGSILLEALRADEIDTSYVKRTGDVSTGVALITVSDDGQNNIVVVPGANSMLSPADIRAAAPAFEGAEAVVVQLEIPMETMKEAVSMACKYGAQVILNPAPAQALDESILAEVDYLVPNEGELLSITGMHSLAQAATNLKSLGLYGLVVTLGDNGVLVLQNGLSWHILPHEVPVVDSTAAGDAFVGAFAVALTEGKPVQEAAVWGNAAGAMAVTRAGAQPSLPNRADLEAFMADHPTWFENESQAHLG